MQPTFVTTRNLLGGRISIHFDNYKAASTSETSSYNNKDKEVQSDEEEIRSEQILVLVKEHPVLKVERLNKEAILPYRQTEGAASYDLFLDKTQHVKANSRALLTIGISIGTPPGTYGRIAPRLGAALLKGIQIEAGVIDADYRGEVKILVFNHTDTYLTLQKGESIAQLISEQITIVDVQEVEGLNWTLRSNQGFGPTSTITVQNNPDQTPLMEKIQKQMNMLDKQMTQLLKDYNIAKAKAIASSFIPDDASSTCSDLDDQTNVSIWWCVFNALVISFNEESIFHSSILVPLTVGRCFCQYDFHPSWQEDASFANVKHVELASFGMKLEAIALAFAMS
ncbi:hypothetical protein ZIOFF_043385 [Zingiber officinale]|uniref:Deoxyuridine 5'-triphosphate nucleotidohydrolase n=1 Tax=Zingiber officinale TaxID=94328 RepID=A0A8J5G414_ZINOF|nr:hypothetical protein ZIOFF_043385 [Zingiber officinale]